MDDYYKIVGVDRTASRDTIDRTLRDQLRHWQQRTSSADLPRRQEAERRVRQLAEARRTLLDERQRRRYDRELTAATGLPGNDAGDPPAPRERSRFNTLPEPVRPDEWVEDVPADTRYQPPEHRFGTPYGYDA